MADLSHLLERIEALENEAGVRLDALYAQPGGCNDYFLVNERLELGIRVNGEIHCKERTAREHNFKIIADGYNEQGSLICATYNLIDAKKFFGFCTFSLLIGGMPTVKITKIRVYPKLEL